jgi:replicative DNA helicase
VSGPFRLDRVADAADEHASNLIVLDYIQRIDPPGNFNGMREKINALMAIMRKLTGQDIGILATSALTSSRDGDGRSSYDGKHLGLASFRESSELEYGCDDAFLLLATVQDEDNAPVRMMTLNHAKSRDAETKQVKLKFFRLLQAFNPVDASKQTAGGSSPSASDRAKKMWANSGVYEAKEGSVS